MPGPTLGSDYQTRHPPRSESFESTTPDGLPFRLPSFGGGPSAAASGAGSAFGYLTLLLLGLSVALLVALIVRSLALRAAPEPQLEAARTKPKGAEAPRITLEDVEALAARGEYAEAVHRLLLLAVRTLEAQRQLEPDAALTAREIVGHAALDPPRRDALVELVREVEASRYGGASVTADRYRTCRASYDRLRRPGAVA